MATTMRWWVWTETGDFGYLFAEEKPQIFTWDYVFITPTNSVRPVKTWSRITKVENYN